MTQILLLTPEEQQFCEYWLEKSSRIWENLNRPQFTYSTLGKMIYYELETRRRQRILDRLIGRYYKLRRQYAMDVIKGVLEEKGEGISYRGILSQKSEEYWRKSL